MKIRRSTVAAGVTASLALKPERDRPARRLPGS